MLPGVMSAMNDFSGNDAFAIFNLPRRPWLEAGELRDQFQRRSADLHPDAGGDAAQFAQFNTAHQTLREPAARLRHLLQLIAPERLAQVPQVPPSLADRFMQVAAVRQTAAAFLSRQRAASSPLTRALLAAEHSTQTQALTEALAELDAAQRDALTRLQEIDRDWTSRLPELISLQAELSYLEKWLAQLRESHLQLVLARPS